MEVLQVTRSPAFENASSVVFGSWFEEEHGLECSRHLVDEFFDDTPCSEDLENYDFYEEASKKLHRKRLLKRLRSLFSKRKKRSHNALDKSSPKKASDNASVASTAASSTCSSIGSRHGGSIKVMSIEKQKKEMVDGDEVLKHANVIRGGASAASTATRSSMCSSVRDGSIIVTSISNEEIEMTIRSGDEMSVKEKLVMKEVGAIGEVASVGSTAAESACYFNLDGSIIVIPISDEDEDMMMDDDITVDDEEPVEDSVPLMQERLFESGVVKSTEDFEFVVDRVSKEVVHLYTEEENEEKRNVSHVKTGVWEIACFDNDGRPQAPFYIVTGVSMTDRVDTKKLRKAVFAGQSYKRRPKLSMAPTETAEELVGFQSGTMAPICHSVDMKLFLEESIVNDRDSDHKIYCGSGMFGKCLSISVDKFLQIARLNPKGVEVCSIIQKAKPPNQNAQ